LREALLVVKLWDLRVRRLSSHVLLYLLTGHLVVIFFVLGLVGGVEVEVLALRVLLRSVLQLLAEDGDLRLVVQVVREESLLRMQLLPDLDALLKSLR
jgi:hypothetical protein